MMFSRMAPTVLFTAFCVAMTGSYVAGERQSLSRPGTPDAAYIEAITAYSNEMALALQVGQYDRFRALLNAQVASAGRQNSTIEFDPDILPKPYQALRAILMRGTLSELESFLGTHPNIPLNTAQGRYGSVPLFWATTHYLQSDKMMDRLIAAGANPEFRTDTGYTLLHAMASPFAFSDPHRIRPVMSESLISARTNTGASALHLALANGQSQLALALLDFGADPNEAAPRSLPLELSPGEPPLVMAGADVDVVEALLFAGADPLARDASGVPVVRVVSEMADYAASLVQDRVSASEAEEYDRQYAADYARVRDMIRAAADGRLAKDG